MLNAFDRKLILALQHNGRATNVDLSQQLQVHVATIAKRIRFLEENEIIKIRALPNPFKLGYSAHALIAIQTKSNRLDEICSRMINNFHINLLVLTLGHYDILAIAYAPTWDKLLNVVFSTTSSIDGIKVDLFIIKENKKRFHGFDINNAVPVKIDQTDQKIIEKLTENGRYIIKHLARELGISSPTCLRRVSRLLDENVIEIKAVPNLSKVGYSANAFLFLQVHNEKLEKVCSTIQSYENIFLIMTLYNRYDLVVGINANNPEELFKFQNTILAIDGIIDNEIVIRGEMKKRYYGEFLV